MEGLVFNIRRYSVQDGPGIRTTIFLKGCPLRCLWCHNPESQGYLPEIFIQTELCIHCGQCRVVCPQELGESDSCLACGACVDHCPAEARVWVGEPKSIDQLMEILKKDILFYDESGGGVTFSGGEPLLQSEFLLALLQECGKEFIHRAVDTSGYAPLEVVQRIAPHTDLFLYDIKHMLEEQHLTYTGVGVSLILTNLTWLMDQGYRGIVRMPYIPGINDGLDHLKALAEFMNGFPKPWPIQLLPYHTMQKSKYEKMGRTYLLPHITMPTGEQIQTAIDFLKTYGLKVEQV